MATWFSKFLKRPTNWKKVIIKGKRVNRGGGYGLEVPCEYLFEGDCFSCGCKRAAEARVTRERVEIKNGLLYKGPTKRIQNRKKTDFPKLCQNKGLGELFLKI